MTEAKDIVLHKPSTLTRKIIEDKPNNMVQTQYISNHLNTPVHVFLSSGVKLECVILSFDETSIVTTQKDNQKKKQLVMLAHVMSIVEIHDYR